MAAPILYLLLLRLRQLGRILKVGGVNLWLLLPVILFFLAATVRDVTLWSVPGMNAILLFLLFLTDAQRSDKRYLFLLSSNGYWLRFCENSLVLMLVNAYALQFQWANLVYLFAALALLALGLLVTGKRNLPFRLGFSKRLTGLLPSNLYDIKSGLRQGFLVFVLLWVAGLFACWLVPAVSFVVALFLILLLEVLIMAEPVVLLQSHRTIRRAVFGKILANLLFFFVLLLPHFLISVWRFHDFVGWISLGISLWILCATVAYAVLLKYAGRQEPGSSIIKSIKIVLFLCVSPLLPLAVFLFYREYKTTLCRLRPLLA